MINLRDIAYTTDKTSDLALSLLEERDPLFSLTVKLWKENKVMRQLLEDREKPPAALIDEELEKIRECPAA